MGTLIVDCRTFPIVLGLLQQVRNAYKYVGELSVYFQLELPILGF
jgi:hypothetical protein